MSIATNPSTRFRKNNGVLWEPLGKTLIDTGIDTDEEAASGETAIDVDADASSAIPVGTIIMIGGEPMSVTATGTTLTVVRTQAVVHATGSDIYKKVNSCRIENKIIKPSRILNSNIITSHN